MLLLSRFLGGCAVLEIGLRFERGVVSGSPPLVEIDLPSSRVCFSVFYLVDPFE